MTVKLLEKLKGWWCPESIKDLVIADLRERLAKSEQDWVASHQLVNHNFRVAGRLERELKVAQRAYDRLNICTRNEVRDAILQGKIDVISTGPNTVINAGLENVTRIEVIDESGRAYSKWDCKVEVSVQDGGRTLKLFVENEHGV